MWAFTCSFFDEFILPFTDQKKIFVVLDFLGGGKGRGQGVGGHALTHFLTRIGTSRSLLEIIPI